MSEVAIRYLQMLDAIPRYPASVTVEQLADWLDQRGFNVTNRSIQRDLDKLSAWFPLLCDDEQRPYHWSFDQSADLITLPGMSMPIALTMKLAESHLRDLLPPKTLAHLHPHFRSANQHLRQTGSQLGDWPDRVRVISKGLFTRRPEVAHQVLETVAESVLRRRQLQLIYQARHWPEPQTINAHPLGLVYREPNIYLIASVDGRDGIRQLVLHRCSDAVMQSDTAAEPDGFDLDTYIASGAMHVLKSEAPIQIRAWCDKPVLSHLLETPLSLDQEVLANDNETFEIRATVGDTQDLRWWLMAQAQHLVLREPEWLVTEIREALADSLRRWETTA